MSDYRKAKTKCLVVTGCGAVSPMLDCTFQLLLPIAYAGPIIHQLRIYFLRAHTRTQES